MRRRGSDQINVGTLQQDPSVIAYVDVEEMLSQAFRRARLDRRRQIERRVAAAERNSQVAAEFAGFPARRSQRIRPLFRRPLAGAQSAQSEAAVLAVQFRRDRRRAVRRPARRARGTRHSRRSHSDGEGDLYPVPERRSARTEAHRSQGGRLYRRYAGALSPGRSDFADRRAHGQAREPLVAHHLSQADFAHRDRAQRSALRLHVRQRQCRRRHHGGSHQPSVPAAGQRPADDDHAACRLPRRSRRFRGVGAVPHGVRFRAVERRRLAAAVRLRRGPSLRLRRPQHRLRADPQGGLAHRQGRPQIRRLSRPRDAASRRTRRHHHFPVQHAVRDAACQRSRPGAVALGGLGRRGEPAVVRPFARHPRSAGFRRRRGAADPAALQGSAGASIAAQRSHHCDGAVGRRRSRHAFRRRRARALARRHLASRRSQRSRHQRTARPRARWKRRCCSPRWGSIPTAFRC